MVVADRVQRLVEDYDKYHSKIYGTKPGRPHCCPKVWSTPPAGAIKVNCDAHLTADGWVGLVAIARNEKGEVLFAGCRRMRGIWPSDIAECKAIVFAAQLARKYNIRRVVLESDSQVVIKRLNKGSTFFSDLDSLLDDVFSICSFFDSVSWSQNGMGALLPTT